MKPIKGYDLKLVQDGLAKPQVDILDKINIINGIHVLRKSGLQKNSS